jgi:hypothetical protein
VKPVRRGSPPPDASSRPPAKPPVKSEPSPAASSPAEPAVSLDFAPSSSNTSVAARGRRNSAGPAIMWVFVGLGGLAAAGGWAMYAMRDDAAATAQTPTSSKAGAKAPAKKPKAVEKPAPAPKDQAPVDPPDTTPQEPEIKDPPPVEPEDPIALPQPDVPFEPPSTKPFSAESIEKLTETCDAFGFLPESGDQYRELIDLAKQMTLAQTTSEDDARSTELTADELQEAVAAADAAFAKISQAQWTVEAIREVNLFASLHLADADSGIVLLGKVAGRGDDATLLDVAGSDTAVLIHKDEHIFTAPPGSIWLILGVTTSQVSNVSRQDRPGEQQTARTIEKRYALRVSGG